MNEMMRGGHTTNLVDINPYLNGIFKPIAQETTIVDCKVIGEIPRDLFGAYAAMGRIQFISRPICITGSMATA